jgi:hypothetical protein
LFQDVSLLLLDNEDLGKAFYERLTEKQGIRLIDFENFENNTFNVVTELTYKKDEKEFRPDIIILINGMPLKTRIIDFSAADQKLIYDKLQNWLGYSVTVYPLGN